MKNDAKSQFIANLFLLLDKANLSQKDAAPTLGITKEYLNALIHGRKVPSPTLVTLVEMKLREAEAAASGLKAIANAVLFPNAHPAEPGTGWHKVPVISFARAGAFIDYQDLIHHLEEWIESDSRDPEAYGVILEGDSMEPRFVAGDRVVVNPNAEARNGDFVVARLREPEGVVFKRFYITGKNGADVRLESLNPIYEPIVRPRSDFDKIQPVVQFFGRVRG